MNKKKSEEDTVVVDRGKSVPLVGLYRDKDREYHVITVNFFASTGECELISAEPTGDTNQGYAHERFKIKTATSGIFEV